MSGQEWQGKLTYARENPPAPRFCGALFTLQCCYDEAGDILVDATTGGGTVDRREAELGGFDEHELEDTKPFEWCCGGGATVNSWLCQLCEVPM